MAYADPVKRRETNRRYQAALRARLDPEERKRRSREEGRRRRARWKAEGRVRSSRKVPPEQMVNHVMVSRDLEAKTGVCKKCGPVEIMKIQNRWYCIYRLAGIRDRGLRSRYGITMSDYLAMYESQQGKCKICSEQHELLHVDHCHDSNRIRGLLCGHCNRALGFLRDRPEIARAAARYLETT